MDEKQPGGLINPETLLKRVQAFAHFVAVCGECQAAAAPDWQFCASCGARLATECPSCGAPLPPRGAHFCPHCGVAIPQIRSE